MFKEQALEKLAKELAEFKGTNYTNVIKEPTYRTLVSFCEQEEEFAQAVVQTDKTLSDVCTTVMKGVTHSLSDIETYQRVVEVYFPGAGIKCSMTIDLCASVNEDKPITMTSSKKSAFELSLDDF